MYQKTLLFILVLFSLFTPGKTHPTPLELTPAEHAWLAAHPVIRLGIDQSRTPYIKLQENGTWVGVEPDLIAEINTLTGAHIQWVGGEWETMVKKAEQGELEGLAITAPLPEHQDRFLFTTSPYRVIGYIYSRGGKNSPFHAMTDLVGKKVGMQRGMLAAQQALARWPTITPVIKESPKELSIALLNRELDAVLDTITLRTLLREQLFMDLDIAFAMPDSQMPVVYSIVKQHPELWSILNKALAAIPPAAIQKILTRWGVNDQIGSPLVELTEAERAWLKSHPDIRLGIDSGFWPYVTVQEDGTVVGVEVDLLARLNALTGANLRLVLGKWTDVVKQAERGELDGLAISSAQPERAVHFLFSNSIHNTSRYIYTRGGASSPIRSMADLAGKKVGMWRGLLIDEKLLAQWPAITPVPLDSPQALGPALANGQVDGLLFPLVLRKFLHDQSFHNLDVAFAVPNSEAPVVYSIRKEHPELLSIINKGLAAITPGEIQEILARWGANYDQSPRQLNFTAEEQAWLQEHPQITLGISDQFQPEVIVNPDGSRSGLIVDYFNLLNQTLGNRLQLHVESDWQTITEKAIKHEIDGLASSAPNPTWDQHFLYSQPYYYNYFHLYTRSNAPAVTGLADLAGKRVGYLAGIKKVEHLLQTAPPHTMVGLKTHEALAKALAEGQVDVVIGRLDFEWWRRQNSNLTIKISGLIPQSRHPVLMSIRKDWPLLPGILNKALNSIPVTERELIQQRWLSVAELSPAQQGVVQLTAEERAYLDKTVFRRAVSIGWMPFSFTDQNDNPVGIGEDYWALIRTKLGLRDTIKGIQPFRSILEDLQQGTLDFHITTSRVKEREDYLVFSDSYEQYPVAFATRKSAGFFLDTAALEGRVVAMGKNYTAYHLLKAQYPKIQFLEVEDTATAIDLVDHGQAFAAADILPALQYQLVQFHGQNVMLAGVTDVQFPLQVGVTKAHARLIPLINRAIAAILPQERLKIQQRWIQQSVVIATDYTLLWQWMGITVLVIGVILYWNRRLVKEIRLRQQTELQLQDTSERLRSILESMEDLVFVIDAQGHFLDSYQPNVASLLVAPEQFLGKHYHTFLPPHIIKLTDRAIAAVQHEGAQHYEYALTMPDGEHWYSVTLSARRNQAGHFDGSTAVIRDMTQRHQMEEALRENEMRLRTLSDNLPNGLIYQINSGLAGEMRQFTYISAGVEKLHGCTVVEVLNDHEKIYGQLLPEDRESLAKVEAQAIATLTPLKVEVRCQLPSHEIQWRLFASAPHRQPSGYVVWDGFEIDITDRKQAELELQLALQRQQVAEHFLRETIDALSAHLCVLDETGKILMVNRAWCQFADENDGQNPDYWIGYNYLNVCQLSQGYGCDSDENDGDDPGLAGFYTLLEWVLKGEIENFDFEYPCHSPTEKRWFVAHVTRFKKAPLRVVVAHENISRRKWAEETVRRSEERHRSLIRAMAEGIVMQNHAGEILECNAAAERILGLTKLQMNRRTATTSTWQTVREDGSPFPAEEYPLSVTLRTGQAQRNIIFGLRQSANEPRWILVNTEPLYKRGVSQPYAAMATFTDITDNLAATQKIEEQRRTLQTLLDHLPAGILMFAAPDAKPLLTNSQAHTLLGQSEIVQTDIQNLNTHYGAFMQGTETLYPIEKMPLTRAFKGEVSMTEDMELRRPDGTNILLQVVGAPVFDEKRHIIAGVVIFQDITERKQTELKYRELSSRLEKIANRVPGMVYQYLVRPDGTSCFPYVSDAIRHIYRVSPAEVQTDASPVLTVLHPDDYNQIIASIQESARTLLPWQLEYRVRHLDGTTRWLSGNANPERQDDGSVLWHGFLSDITDRKQADLQQQANQARLARIVATVPGVLYDYVLHPDGLRRFLYLSPRCAEIFGVDAETLMRDFNVFSNLVHPEDLPRLLEADHLAIRQGNYFHHEVRIVTPSGQLKWIVFNSRPNPPVPDSPTVWTGHIIEVTAQKEAEEALIQARQAAEVANRAKSAFIANMSHELRTPLNAILGFAQILLQDPHLDKHLLDHVQRIQRGGDYLLTLINDILDLAKIEAGRFELYPEVWNPQMVFQELSYMFQLRAEQKGIGFQHETTTPLPRSLYSDNKRLRQILINLLGNAVKFTEHGTVKLRTGYEKDCLCLEVEDSGVGIATADLDKIFKPFQQTGADRYKAQGTGLGLSITHRIVQAMGGTLQVTSTLGKGTVFHVVVPAEVVSTLAEAQQPADQPTVVGYRRTDGDGQLRVLVVDDLEDNREVARHLLEPLGFQIAEVENGQHCLDLVPDFHPDMILMDLRLPGLDGLQTTRILRSQGFTKPIIVLSASTFSEDRTASLEAGSNAHLPKPVRLTELLNLLKQFLPLKWEYAVPPAIANEESEGLTLAELLPEEAEQLFHLTRMGDILGMEHFVNYLEKSHQQRGGKLRELVSTFEFEKILEWLGRTNEG